MLLQLSLVWSEDITVRTHGVSRGARGESRKREQSEAKGTQFSTAAPFHTSTSAHWGKESQGAWTALQTMGDCGRVGFHGKHIAATDQCFHHRVARPGRQPSIGHFPLPTLTTIIIARCLVQVRRSKAVAAPESCVTLLIWEIMTGWESPRGVGSTKAVARLRGSTLDTHHGPVRATETEAQSRRETRIEHDSRSPEEHLSSAVCYMRLDDRRMPTAPLSSAPVSTPRPSSGP
ncbi:hypothetical protein CORC01_13853 [Colletotrichum orchidophilum]|uniref:Uncharacterized protein n=1 Tax=Colletotrichum orchidophilum TaxID=1209926 RepID=A0A1G4ANT6_9PEZI|nr:uncharacterized protein CORC01_13853 [Colletotrichum orchidophilum]OHE90850.1 hypothetical protein CORC01_13853 [Colletotrichum orchidophilum]